MELTPVDDTVDGKLPVIRLGREKSSSQGEAVRLAVPKDVSKVSQRLDVPAHEDFDSRTHQPGIEALIEIETVNPNQLEQDWGKESIHHKSIPWGWFILVGTILASGIIWSLSGVKNAAPQADKIRVKTETTLDSDAREDAEAGKLIVRIDNTIRKFFDATDVETLARFVRQPARVRPLMDAHYGGKSVPLNRLIRSKVLQPLTLDQRANFWMESVELANHESRNLIIEILESGEPRIDWETMVCYQPMKWDSYATDRPSGASFDFRVYLEADNFYSHEFADPLLWNCYRLTALDSEETLFGYAKANDEVALALQEIVRQNQGRRASIIVRLTVPDGVQSRRGVVIERVLSPRWIYLDPPDT